MAQILTHSHLQLQQLELFRVELIHHLNDVLITLLQVQVEVNYSKQGVELWRVEFCLNIRSSSSSLIKERINYFSHQFKKKKLEIKKLKLIR